MTDTQTIPSACPDCLRRGELLSKLAPYIERETAGEATRVEQLLELDNEHLVDELDAHRLLTEVEGLNVRALRAKVKAAECWSVCPHVNGYPVGLLHLQTSAGAIYGRGDHRMLIELIPVHCVSVVGARRASSYGREVARSLGRSLAEANQMVISGMAFGVDACAQRGALEVGRTVAVLGCGPDVAYPAAHRSLWRRIQEKGLVISELPPGTGAWRWAFPARNRIIAALSGMTVVVEATEGSGSMGTARAAEALNRKVGAVPGSVLASSSNGPNQLLMDGAVLVRNGDDVLRATGCIQEVAA